LKQRQAWPEEVYWPMSDAALQLDDFNNQDLRDVADRLLETTRVEYVDEGALLIMNPPGIEHRRIVRSIIGTVKRVGFAVPTANWPRWLP
jgi:Uma2 family endonuclease